MKKIITPIVLLCLWGYAKGQDQLTNSGNLFILPGTSVTFFGNITNNGTITDSGQMVTLAGTTNQVIAGSSNTNFKNLTVNNSSATGITISNTQTGILNSLTLVDGYINTASGNLLVLYDNATASGASNASYVSGPIKKTGNDAFTFPVGKSGNYQPASISAPGNVSDAFTGEYFYADPRGIYSAAVDSSLHHVEAHEYWVINRTAGTSTVNLTLGWNSNSGLVTALADLRIVRWNGTKWNNFGNGGTTGNSIAGTIITSPVAPSYGAFSLGSMSFQNPLPISLLTFSAKENNSYVDINWTTVEETNNNYFTVERSRDKVHYETVAIVQGAGTSNQVNNYFTQDMKPYRGISYYRLKQTDYNGNSIYSKNEAVNFDGIRSYDVTVFPNPVAGDHVSLSVPETAAESIQVTIADINGKVYYSKTFAVTKNASTLDIDGTKDLAAGVYYVFVSFDDHTSTTKLVVSN